MTTFKRNLFDGKRHKAFLSSNIHNSSRKLCCDAVQSSRVRLQRLLNAVVVKVRDNVRVALCVPGARRGFLRSCPPGPCLWNSSAERRRICGLRQLRLYPYQSELTSAVHYTWCEGSKRIDHRHCIATCRSQKRCAVGQSWRRHRRHAQPDPKSSCGAAATGTRGSSS